MNSELDTNTKEIIKIAQELEPIMMNLGRLSHVITASFLIFTSQARSNNVSKEDYVKTMIKILTDAWDAFGA